MFSDGGTREGCEGHDGQCHLRAWSVSEEYLWSDYFHSEGQKVYRYLYKRLGNKEAAEDCFQQTFEQFFSRIDTFDLERPLLQYLIGIARNVANDYVSKKAPAPLTDQDLSDIDSISFECSMWVSHTDTVEAFAHLSLVETLIELAELSEIDGEIFRLCAINGLAPREIAAILCDNPKNVRQRLWRIRRKIQAFVDRSDFSTN